MFIPIRFKQIYNKLPSGIQCNECQMVFFKTKFLSIKILSKKRLICS